MLEEAACGHLQRSVPLFTEIHPGQEGRSDTDSREHRQQDPWAGQGRQGGKASLPEILGSFVLRT